jgi:hypothetical protein
MTPEILDLLFELIDTKIAEHVAEERSNDGGLIESVKIDNIKTKLRALVQQ